MFDSVAIKFGEPVWHDQPYQHPILQTTVERDFYGFTELRQCLHELFAQHTTDPILIFGERRSGKTSMLKLLIEQLANDPTAHTLPILIPWEGVQSRYELAKTILQYARGQVNKYAAPDGARTINDDIAAATSSGLVAELKKLAAYVPGKLLVIFIDEFDSILAGSSPDGQKRILSLTDAIVAAHGLPCKLVMTMTHMPDFPAARTSPLLTRAHRLRLHPFTPNELDEMLQGIMGPVAQRLGHNDRESLFALSGGWPYFAKLLLLYMAEIEPSPGWIDQALDQALDHWGTEQTLNNLYEKHLSDDEKALLLLLAQHEGTLDGDAAAALPAPLRAAAQSLIERDFVVATNNGSGYHFRIDFLNEWLNNWVRYEQEVERRLTPALTHRNGR